MKPLADYNSNQRRSMSYEDLIESAGLEILAREDEGSYEGETMMLVAKEDEYGVIAYNWGSCTHCDALEACYGKARDLEELREYLVGAVEWRNKADAIAHLDAMLEKAKKDWTGFNRQMTRRFVGSAKAVLEA